MFALAERYSIHELRALCIKKYKSRLDRGNEPIEYMHSILDVYSLTPESVRDMRDIAARHVRVVMSTYKGGETAKAFEVQRLYEYAIQNIPGLVKDLLNLYIETPIYGVCGRCERAILPSMRIVPIPRTR